MMDRSRFEEALQEVLTRLYDPNFSVCDDLWEILGGSLPRTHLGLQEQVADQIRRMEPQDSQPGAYRTRRYYQVLHYRYVLELTQKETAHRMQVSPRHLRREQQQAVQVLAQRIWEKWERLTRAGDESSPAIASRQDAATADNGTSEGKVTQVQREIALLQDHSPNVSTEVGGEIERVVRVMEEILAARNIELVQDCAAGMRVQLHPSVFRQILIGAIDGLASQMDGGCILVRARTRKRGISVAVCGNPFTSNAGESAWRLFAGQTGCSTAFVRSGRQGIFLLGFPPMDKYSVLVVDDNVDIVHVFRRYTIGTQFQIQELILRQHLHPEQRSADLLTQVAEMRPDVIVLDVLMPDLDGWELLGELRREARTREIPVIVCSVIGANGLADALGASAHLSKPVSQEEFLATLARVCHSVHADSQQDETRFPQ